MNYNLEEEARKKVRSLKRLYRHMSVYSIMGVFFFLLNVVTSPFEMWWFFPLLPWGVIVAIHYVVVKGIPATGILTKEWEDQEYEHQLNLLKGDYNRPFLDEPQEDNYLRYQELSQEEIAILRDGFLD